MNYWEWGYTSSNTTASVEIEKALTLIKKKLSVEFDAHHLTNLCNPPGYLQNQQMLGANLEMDQHSIRGVKYKYS